MAYTRPALHDDAAWVAAVGYTRPASINDDATWLTSTLVIARSAGPLTAGQGLAEVGPPPVRVHARSPGPLTSGAAVLASPVRGAARSAGPLGTGRAVVVHQPPPVLAWGQSSGPLGVSLARVEVILTILSARARSPGPLTVGQAVVAVGPPPVRLRAQSHGPLTSAAAVVTSPTQLIARSAGPLGPGQAVLSRLILDTLAARVVLPAALLTVNRARTRIVLPSGSLSADPIAARLVLPSGRSLGVRVLLPSASTAPLAARVVLPAAMPDSDRLCARVVLLASLLDGTVQVMAPLPELHHGDRILSPLSVMLSADLGSSLWQAEIALADSADYGPIRIGDALDVVIGDAIWRLLCDSKQRTRPTGYTIKALSAGARLGAPWARPGALGDVGMAHAVSERLLGEPITWELPDWALPSAAASLNAPPLALVRLIVAAVGGVLEARPDGAWVARPQCPLSPPTASGPVQAVLTDATLFEHSEAVGAPEIANRYTITSGDGSAGTAPVQIEVVADEADATHRTVRAYPYPWLDLDLVHTGDETVIIGPRSEVHLTKQELLAIVAGEASTGFPVESITSQVYRYVPLGTVAVTGKALQTATAAYSQIDLTYLAHAWQWEVYHPRIETIQFLAVEPS